MDNLFEIIVPIIFAAIYFFGNMLSGKSDDASAPAPRREEDPDAAERQRRIQEEIRRKIMERRGQSQEGGRSRPLKEATSEADKSLHERRAAVEERRRQRELTRRSEPSQQRTEPSVPHPVSRIPYPVSREEPTFGGGASDDVYTTQMQERLRQIEATKRQAAKLQEQAAKVEKSARSRSQPSHSSLSTPHSPLARGSVRSTLRDPAAARAAFIYGEVLGTPTSMKKAPTVPGLS